MPIWRAYGLVCASANHFGQHASQVGPYRRRRAGGM